MGWNPTHMDASERWARLAVEADPDHANAWVVYGQVKYARQELDESLKMLTHAETLDPSSAKLRLRKGATLRALSETRGGHALLVASAKEFQQAIHGKVDDGNELLAASELADIFSKLGEQDKALDYSSQAMAWAKGNSKAFLLDRRANIHLMAGDTDAALADSEAALSILDFGVGQQTLTNILLVKAGMAVRDGRTAEIQPLVDRAQATGADPWRYLDLLVSQPATFPAVHVFVDPEAKGNARAQKISRMLVLAGDFISASDVQRLHRMGIEFHAQDEFRGTILHRAIQANNVGAVKELLDLDADATIPYPGGRTSLELAMTGTSAERKEIRRLILAKTGTPQGWKEPDVDLPLAGHWYAADRAIGTTDGQYSALPAGKVVLVETSDCTFLDRTDICLELLERPGTRFGTIAIPLSKLDDLKALKPVPAPSPDH
jgi:tetratricopeptide (TPR) repeat protein